jgi:hypothetical protein
MTWQLALDWIIVPGLAVAVICGAALWGVRHIP